MSQPSSSLTKAERMILVLETLKSLGRATPDEVLKRVAVKASLNSDDKNLRRNIYRDLKDFATNGDVDVDYFTPSGEKIAPGEEEGFKNLRAEYYMRSAQENVPGAGRLQQAQIQFYPQRPKTIHWNVTDTSSGFKDKCFSVIVQGPHESFISLNVPLDEMPVKLLVARSVNDDKWRPPQMLIEERFGMRTSLITFPQKTLSRIGDDSRFGHAVIEVSRTGEEVVVRDLTSSTGTFFAPANQKSLKKILESDDLDKTLTFDNHPFYVPEASWQTIEGTSARMATPLFLKMGQLTLIVLNGSKAQSIS